MSRTKSDEDDYKLGWDIRVLMGVKVGVIVFIGLSVFPLAIIAGITTMLACVFLVVRSLYIYAETAFLIVFDYFFPKWRRPHIGAVDYRTTMYKYEQYWTNPDPEPVYRGYRYGYGSGGGSGSDSDSSDSPNPSARSSPSAKRYLSPSDDQARRRRSTTPTALDLLRQRDAWRAPADIAATPETISISRTGSSSSPGSSPSGTPSSTPSSSPSSRSSSGTERTRNSAAAALTLTPSNSNSKRARDRTPKVRFETPLPRLSRARERRIEANRRRFEEQEREEYEKYFLRADLEHW